ncbi:pinopsin-like [Emydura macquarii macquarii]|uniref:pinopsin-like n=1 Tax=Emydura macquarii macquarii TaxID=1129001 RepID=UPI00352B2F66
MRLVLAERSLNLTEPSWAGGSGSPASAAGGLGRTGHSVVAACLGITQVLGCLHDLLVESVRTPVGLILLNISLSDLLLCVFGTPASLTASLRGRWLLGRAGCRWYGFANALFVNYIFVHLHDEITYLTVLNCALVSRFNMTTVQKRERPILFMVVSMVTCYLLCWMPYGIVSLIATFGKPGIITPTGSIAPSILAKTSTFVNPVLYVLLNKQFYRCFVTLIKCGPFPQHTETILNSKENQNFERAGRVIEIPLSQMPADEKQNKNDTECSSKNQKTLVVHYTI